MKCFKNKLFVTSVDASKMGVPSSWRKIYLFAVLLSMMWFAGLAIAADITACDLIDKNAAGELLGRPISGGPYSDRLPPTPGKNGTACTFRYAGDPHVILIVVVTEFETLPEAKKWIDKASAQPAGKTDFQVAEEHGVGDAIVWTQEGVFRGGYEVRKGNRIVSFQLRGSAVLSGSKFSGFRVTPELRAKLRETMRRALNKF